MAEAAGFILCINFHTKFLKCSCSNLVVFPSIAILNLYYDEESYHLFFGSLGIDKECEIVIFNTCQLKHWVLNFYTNFYQNNFV